MAPGKTSHTPAVATVSRAPVCFGGSLFGKHDFGGGAEGIAALRHEYGARVPALAFDPQTQAGGCGNRRDNPQRNSRLFQQGALFDVQFHEGAIVARGQANLREVAAKARGGAPIVEGAAVFVAQMRPGGCIQRAGHKAAAEAPDAETRGLFRAENEKFDGAARGHAGALQQADRFKSAQHTDGAVVGAGVGDGVDVRPGGDGGQRGVGALPSREDVAHGVFANVEAGVAAEALHIFARAPVRFRIDHARDGGRGRVGERRQGFQFVLQTHNGWRFQSL